MKGVSIIGFFDKKRRGELLPHTNFHQVKWTGQWLGGTFHSEKLKTPGKGDKADITNFRGVPMPSSYRILDAPDYDCSTFGAPSPPGDYWQSLLQRAAGNAYSKGFDLLTSAAEARESWNLFKQIANHIVTFRNRTRRLNSSDLADAWLTYRYGVRPILNDLESLNHAINEWDKVSKISSERAGLSISDNGNETIVEGHRQGNLTYDLDTTWDMTHSLRGSVTGKFKASRIITNPVRTAWELVPYSFVFDWVIDVGSYLDSMSYRLLSSQWAASYGFKTTYSRSYNLTGYSNSDYSGSASATYLYTMEVDYRSPSSISNLPQVRYNPFNAFQAADLLSLLRQTVRYR